MKNVEQFLQSKQIQYVLHEHPAVFTTEEAEKYCADIPGLACKNLFLKGKKGECYFLLVVPAHKRTDLKKFAETIGQKKVMFASAETLHEKLGLTPGAVSPFGLLNDQDKVVEVYIDREVYESTIVSFHPNRNTASVELSKAMFHTFLQTIEHEIHIIDL